MGTSVPSAGRRCLPALLGVLTAAIVGRAGASPPAPPPTSDDEEELRRALEQDRQAQEATQSPTPAAGLTPGNALNPAISIVLDVAGAWFSDDENHQRGAHDPDASGFVFQQLELSASAAVDPYFKFDSCLVFTLSGVEVEEAYATSLSLPWNLQLRAGQMLTRFGRANATHPHRWDLVDQPLLLGKMFGGEAQRGVGAELSVLMPLPWYLELSGTAMGAGGGPTMRSFWGDSDLEVDGVEDLLYVATVKQFWALGDDWSAGLGLSGAFGPNATGRDNRTEIYGVDLFVQWRPISRASYQRLSLTSEWMLRRRQVPAAVLQDWGGYTQLAWRFARRWGATARWELHHGVEGDPLDPLESGLRHRTAAAITFWPTEYSRVRLQYGADLPSWRDVVVHSIFLNIELAVGAHGAHTL